MCGGPSNHRIPEACGERDRISLIGGLWVAGVRFRQALDGVQVDSMKGKKRKGRGKTRCEVGAKRARFFNGGARV